MHKRLALFGAVTAAAVLLVACSSTIDGAGQGSASTSTPAATSTTTPAGSSAPASAAGADLDPCALLSQSEAEALAGTKLGAAVASGGDGVNTLCQYIGPATGPLAQVEIIVGAGAEKSLQIDRDVLKHAFRLVAGIGDKAYEEDDNIFIQKGQQWAQINLVLLNDAAQNRTALETAARIVASRM